MHAAASRWTDGAGRVKLPVHRCSIATVRFDYFRAKAGEAEPEGRYFMERVFETGMKPSRETVRFKALSRPKDVPARLVAYSERSASTGFTDAAR